MDFLDFLISIIDKAIHRAAARDIDKPSSRPAKASRPAFVWKVAR